MSIHNTSHNIDFKFTNNTYKLPYIFILYKDGYNSLKNIIKFPVFKYIKVQLSFTVEVV